MNRRSGEFQSSRSLRTATADVGMRIGYYRYFNPRGPCGPRHPDPVHHAMGAGISILAVLADRDSKDAQKICRVFVQSGEYSLRTKKFSAGRTEKPTSSLPFPVRFPVRTCPGASGRLALALDHQGLFRQVGLLAAKVLDLAFILFPRL